MIARIAPAAVFAATAVLLVAGWGVVSMLGWADSLTVLTGDGEPSDVARSAAVLAAWFGAVLGAPILATAAALDLLLPAVWRHLRGRSHPEPRIAKEPTPKPGGSTGGGL